MYIGKCEDVCKMFVQTIWTLTFKTKHLCVCVCVWGGGTAARVSWVRPRAVRDLSGCLCTGRDIVLEGWHQHFQGVFNVQSSYDIHAIEEAEDYPLRSELADPPIEEELVEALRKMKVEKAR